MCNISQTPRHKSTNRMKINSKCCYKYHRRYQSHQMGKFLSPPFKYFQMRSKTNLSVCSSFKSSSSYVFLLVIYSVILLVPNATIVGCSVLEEFGHTFQSDLGNVEIEDISNEYNGVGAQRQGRQFQDDAFAAPNLNPFNIQPQTPQPSFRDISGGGGGFGGFANQGQANYGNQQVQSVSLPKNLKQLHAF